MVIKLYNYSNEVKVINAKHIVSLDYEDKSGTRTSSDGYHVYEWKEKEFVITITMINGKEYIRTFQDEDTAKIFYNTVLSEMGEKEFRMNLKKD